MTEEQKARLKAAVDELNETLRDIHGRGDTGVQIIPTTVSTNAHGYPCAPCVGIEVVTERHLFGPAWTIR